MSDAHRHESPREDRWSRLGHPKWTFEKGLHDLGRGCWAWLQPDGGWGWSNAGLITDGDATLLVDTLFDLSLTREMLDAMRRAVPSASEIDTLVNTHANGDHCFGNELVTGAEIVASSAAAAEMTEAPPERLAGMMAMAKQALASDEADEEMRQLGRYLVDCFGDFEFDGITLTPPTRTFDGRTTLRVGEKQVELIEVGPAHTGGDTLVHVPDDRVVYTGDILFVEGHPIVWAGPVSNWLRACDVILELDAEVVVPGHGPIADRRAAEAMKSYFETLWAEAKERFDEGMSVDETVRDLELEAFRAWGDPERIAINVDSIYRELRGDAERTDVLELFRAMSRLV